MSNIPSGIKELKNGKFRWFIGEYALKHGIENTYGEAELAVRAAIAELEAQREKNRIESAQERETIHTETYRGVDITVTKITQLASQEVVYMADAGWANYRKDTQAEALDNLKALIDVWHNSPLDRDNPLFKTPPVTSEKTVTKFVDDGFPGEIVVRKVTGTLKDEPSN